MRVPRHIGVIPDGNRRWAQGQGMTKDKGYSYGIDPGYKLFKLCEETRKSKKGIYRCMY